MPDRVPAMLRLRSAGVGVVAGGIALAVLGTALSFRLAAGLVLIEATTAAGLGFGPQQLGGAGVVFGLVDIVAGTVIYRIQHDPAG